MANLKISANGLECYNAMEIERGKLMLKNILCADATETNRGATGLNVYSLTISRVVIILTAS